MKTKTQLSKQIFSILLCLTLMLTYVPVTVFARVANAIYYDANGGEGGPSNNFTGGTTATVSKNAPTRTGYVFDGWNTKADGTGEDYSGGSTYTFVEDDGNGGCKVTLYAQWSKVYGIYVGGVQVTDMNQDDVFGDGKVSYNDETNTLILNDYSYEGDGYQYGTDVDTESGETQYYTAAVYSTNDITIELRGNNKLENTFTISQNGQYGDGVVSGGDITITGDGTLTTFGYYGIDATGTMQITDCTVSIDSESDGIGTNGSVTVADAKLSIRTGHDGIYAGSDITITDSTVDITAGGDGVYVYDGNMTINCTKVALASGGFGFAGTNINVTAGEGAYAFKVDIGKLIIGDKLTVSAPAGGKVKTFNATYNGEDYTYDTIVDAAGKFAANVTIEPLQYTVSISGLSYDMTVSAPAGQSLNAVYCEMYQVKDFSEILDTRKEGYIFGGWYTDEACTDGNAFGFNDSVNADITVYAKWVPVYVPTVEKTDGGDVTVSHESVIKGETVVITPKPGDGKEVDTVTVTDKDGTLVAVSQNDDGTYSFIQPESNVTVKVTYKDKQAGTTVDDTEKDDNKPTDLPQTGDTSNMVLWFTLMLLSGGAVFAIVFYGKKRKNEVN